MQREFEDEFGHRLEAARPILVGILHEDAPDTASRRALLPPELALVLDACALRQLTFPSSSGGDLVPETSVDLNASVGPSPQHRRPHKKFIQIPEEGMPSSRFVFHTRNQKSAEL